MTDFKDLALRQPINKLAKRVTSPGINHEWTPPFGVMCTKTLPELRDMSYHPLKVKPPQGSQFKDYSGTILGLSIVIGLAKIKRHGNSKRARWVVRCNCSYYFLVTTKDIRDFLASNETPLCPYCKEQKEIK